MLTTKTIIIIAGGLALSTLAGCSSHKEGELLDRVVYEHNQQVNDLAQVNYIHEGLCVRHTQEVSEIKDYDGKHPVAFYKLTQQQVKCPD